MMEEGNEVKELYHCNNWSLNGHIEAYNKLVPVLNELAGFYNELGFKKPFDKILLLSAMTNKSELINHLKKELQSTLAKLAMPKLFLSKFMEEIDLKLNELSEKVNKVVRVENSFNSFGYPITFDYTFFEFNDSGKIVFPENCKQKIQDEFCSIWIENENQKRAIELTNLINSNFEALRMILSDSNIDEPLQVGSRDYSGAFKLSEGGTFELLPGIVSRIQ